MEKVNQNCDRCKQKAYEPDVFNSAIWTAKHIDIMCTLCIKELDLLETYHNKIEKKSEQVNSSEHLGYAYRLIHQMSSEQELEANLILVSEEEYKYIKNYHVSYTGSQVFTCVHPKTPSVHFQDGIKHFMDMEKNDIKLCSFFFFWTYIYPLFSKYPYLFINAPKGSGKSKLIKLLTWSSYKGQITGNTSVAGIYFHIEKNKGTLGFDEQEILNSRDKSEEITNILLNGFEKGTPVLRVPKNSKGTNELKEYDVYCPKIIANIEGIKSSALESRIIPIKLIRTLDSMKANRYPEKIDKLFSDLQLWGLEFAYENKDDILSFYLELRKDEELGLVGRVFDLFAPLLAVCKIAEPEYYDEFLTYCLSLGEIIMGSSNVDTNESRLIESVKHVYDNGYENKDDEEGKWITTRDLRSSFVSMFFEGETPKWLSYNKMSLMLNGIGFNRKKKFNNGVNYLIDEVRLNRLLDAYTEKEFKVDKLEVKDS